MPRSFASEIRAQRSGALAFDRRYQCRKRALHPAAYRQRRFVAPVAAIDSHELGFSPASLPRPRLLVDVGNHAGAQDGAFANTRRAVKDRKGGRPQVRGDDRALLAPAEEISAVLPP